MSELEKNYYFIGLDIGNTNIAFAIYKEITKDFSVLKNSSTLTKNR